MRNWLRKLLGRPTDGRTILLERVKKAPEIQDALVLNAPLDVAKMSAIIWDFAQPWLEEVTEDEEVRAILGAAITAWNLSLLPPSECEQQFQVLLLPKLARRHQIMVRKMITRRRTHFANHQRRVVDYVIESDAHQLHLDVVSTL